MLVFLVTGAGAFGLGLRTLRTGEAELEPGERALVRWLVLPLSAYLLLKALFHFTSVLTWEQGWWYYSGQIFAFDFLVALALARLLAMGRRVFAPALALLILVTTLQVLDTGRRMNALYDSYAATFFVLWQDREALGRALQALDPEMKLIDNTDGLYAFMLDVPAASVTGLVFSEAEMEMAMREGVAVSLVKRGYDVLPVLTDDRWKGHYRALDRIRPRAKLLHEHERSGVRFYRLSNE